MNRAVLIPHLCTKIKDERWKWKMKVCRPAQGLTSRYLGRGVCMRAQPTISYQWFPASKELSSQEINYLWHNFLALLYIKLSAQLSGWRSLLKLTKLLAASMVVSCRFLNSITLTAGVAGENWLSGWEHSGSVWSQALTTLENLPGPALGMKFLYLHWQQYFCGESFWLYACACKEAIFSQQPNKYCCCK